MIPIPYKLAAGAAILVALFGAGYWQGYSHEHRAWVADTARRNAAESAAIIARQAENAKIAQQQAESVASIQKAHDDEIATIRARLAASERMRKPAFCGGPAAATEAESTTSSHAADPGAGLVPIETQRDFEALTIEVETALAAGRACQAFVRANGMD